MGPEEKATFAPLFANPYLCIRLNVPDQGHE